MDDWELARQLVKSLRDALNSGQLDLASHLRRDLAEVNARLLRDCWVRIVEA